MKVQNRSHLSYLRIFRVIWQFLTHLCWAWPRFSSSSTTWLPSLPLLPLSSLRAESSCQDWTCPVNTQKLWLPSWGRHSNHSRSFVCRAKNNQNTSAGSWPSQANRLVQLVSLKQLIGGVCCYWNETHVYTQTTQFSMFLLKPMLEPMSLWHSCGPTLSIPAGWTAFPSPPFTLHLGARQHQPCLRNCLRTAAIRQEMNEGLLVPWIHCIKQMYSAIFPNNLSHFYAIFFLWRDSIKGKESMERAWILECRFKS